MTKEPARFAAGDKVIFLGSKKSCYGTNRKSDKYIENVVTIKNIHPAGYPYAYTFREFEIEFGIEYWFSESCFIEALPELPEFEIEGDLGLLFQ